MSRPCEVCESLGSKELVGATRKRVRRMLVQDRVIALCDPHADRVRASGADTVEAVRALFVEKTGKRSLLARRSPLDRRIFPPRPEGRRRSDGRREADAVE